MYFLDFDPMIDYPDWHDDYMALLQQLHAIVPAEQIAWISIGSLRFNPEQKRIMENNFRGSKITCQEMVTGRDNKVRYIKPRRIEVSEVEWRQKQHVIHVIDVTCTDTAPERAFTTIAARICCVPEAVVSNWPRAGVLELLKYYDDGS